VNEQPLNLRASVREIWRRRLLVIVIAGLCGLGGVLYGFLRPPNDSAVALVLLPASTTSASGAAGNTGNTGTAQDGITTEAVIAKSTPVLAAAGARLSPPLGEVGVKKLVTVTPISGQVLQIQAQAATTRYAAQLANAVAASFADYVGQLEASAAGLGVPALQKEAGLLTTQVKDLQAQINTVSARITSEGAGSNAGERDVALLGSLQSEQNQVSLQLNSVTSEIATAKGADGSTQDTARLLQPATAEPQSTYAHALEAGIIGCAIGLLGAMIFVLVRLAGAHRLRLRDEIARAAGAPVIGSLDAPSCTTPSAWREFLEGRPRATNEWTLRHLLYDLRHSGDQTPVLRLRVISFDGDSPGLSTGPRLALYAAASGISTSLVSEGIPASKNRSLVSLWAAFTGSKPLGRGLPFMLGLKHGDDLPQLLVSIVVFDGKSELFSPPGTVNLASISANAVTADQIAHLALQAEDGGSALTGVAVVNPDPTDNSTGVVEDDTLRPLRPQPIDVIGEGELVHAGARPDGPNPPPGGGAGLGR
jgi:capsular polysaccharide biosynthesis protein